MQFRRHIRIPISVFPQTSRYICGSGDAKPWVKVTRSRALLHIWGKFAEHLTSLNDLFSDRNICESLLNTLADINRSIYFRIVMHGRLIMLRRFVNPGLSHGFDSHFQLLWFLSYSCLFLGAQWPLIGYWRLLKLKLFHFEDLRWSENFSRKHKIVSSYSARLLWYP